MWFCFIHFENVLLGVLVILHLFLTFYKNILFIYSQETERERKAETQAEGEAGSIQGA